MPYPVALSSALPIAAPNQGTGGAPRRRGDLLLIPLRGLPCCGWLLALAACFSRGERNERDGSRAWQGCVVSCRAGGAWEVSQLAPSWHSAGRYAVAGGQGLGWVGQKR